MNRNDEKLKVLITGASRGIGAAIARKYLLEGHIVLAPTRSELELSDSKRIKDYLAQKCPEGVDVLINNAGINDLSAIDDFDFETFDRVVNVNLIAPVRLIAGLCKQMMAKKRGWIVNVSSVWSLAGKEKRLPYSASKAAMNGATRTLAVELGKHNILVNSICPGYVNTDMTKKNVPSDERAIIEEFIPLKRFAEPEELADAIYFLGSGNNTYITGHTLVVDGGYLSK